MEETIIYTIILKLCILGFLQINLRSRTSDIYLKPTIYCNKQ